MFRADLRCGFHRVAAILAPLASAAKARETPLNASLSVAKLQRDRLLRGGHSGSCQGRKVKWAHTGAATDSYRGRTRTACRPAARPDRIKAGGR
jgi:hypothetical protein